MAAQEIAAIQPLKAQQVVPGSREAQAPPQELQKPRQQDEIEVSREAQDRGKTEATRAGEQGRDNAAQVRAAAVARQEETKALNAAPEARRVDITA